MELDRPVRRSGCDSYTDGPARRLPGHPFGNPFWQSTRRDGEDGGSLPRFEPQLRGTATHVADHPDGIGGPFKPPPCFALATNGDPPCPLVSTMSASRGASQWPPLGHNPGHKTQKSWSEFRRTAWTAEQITSSLGRLERITWALKGALDMKRYRSFRRTVSLVQIYRRSSRIKSPARLEQQPLFGACHPIA